MHEFRMPSLGADMDAGTLVEWMVKPGDRVKRGQVVAVVETQKGAIEVEIWDDGTVDRLVVPTGTKVPVGEVLALLRAAGEPAGEAPARQPAEAPVKPPAEARPAPAAPRVEAAPPIAAGSTGRARISPSARKLAEDLGITIESVQPAEPGGVVSRADVERAAAAGKAPPAEAAGPKPGPAGWHAQMRKAIAAAMSRSKREIPHYYLASDIDVTAVTDWLAAENLKRSVAERLLPVVPLMKAVALALREVPELNGFWTPEGFKPSTTVHLGMAIAMRGGGLVAPAVHDADKLGLDALMAGLRDLIARVRGGRLRSSEMSDPTITLTSLGEQGVEGVFAVIYPPQVAIVGLGKITVRPRVVDSAVVARKVLTATLAADHRVSDGHRGALFLAALGRLLNEPEKLR
jgi:pyruvate dehydrogenase E2 component (dihydrolipoyllysine-residue acetyltransferase)